MAFNTEKDRKQSQKIKAAVQKNVVYLEDEYGCVLYIYLYKMNQ